MQGVGAIVVVVWIATIAATIDAFRRPRQAWIVADRNRSFWTVGLAMSCVLLIAALYYLPGYLFGCVPAFQVGGSQRAASNDSEFRR